MSAAIDGKGTRPDVSITVSVDNEPHEPAPDRVIAGHPARVWSDEFNFDVTLYGVAGYRVIATMNNAAGRDKVSEDQVMAMALSVTPHGLPSDRSQWTNSPLR
jgi:hypothetical protein